MRTTLITLAAAAVALAVAGPSLADDQLAASAGLAPSAAAGLSLTEIAQAKFNRDSENRQTVVEPRAATPRGPRRARRQRRLARGRRRQALR